VGERVESRCTDGWPVDDQHASGVAQEMVSVATSTREVTQVRAGAESVVLAGTRWAKASPAGVGTAWKARRWKDQQWRRAAADHRDAAGASQSVEGREEAAMNEIPRAGRAWTVAMVLVGVAALLAKPLYRGPLERLVWSYLGNVSASFSTFFIASLATWNLPRARLVAALAALAAVESFELLDGFGIMTNTYDPWDLVANALGVGLAWSLASLAPRPRIVQ
jgi:hypothetical protein